MAVKVMNNIIKNISKNKFKILGSTIISIWLIIITISFWEYDIINSISNILIKSWELNWLRIFLIFIISGEFIIKINKKPKKNEIKKRWISIIILSSAISWIIIDIITNANILFWILMGLFINIWIAYLLLLFWESLKWARKSPSDNDFDDDYDFDSGSDNDFWGWDFGWWWADWDR